MILIKETLSNIHTVHKHSVKCVHVLLVSQKGIVCVCGHNKCVCTWVHVYVCSLLELLLTSRIY